MTAYAPIFARGLGTGDNDYFFGLLPDSMGGFLVMDIAGTIQATDTKAMQLNTWTHVAASRTAGIISLFVNGQLVASVANTTSMNPNEDIRIGRGRGTSSDYFIGYIDDFRITKGVCRYVKAFTPPGRFADAGIADQFWASTVLALPLDGVNNSTTVIDYKGKAVTCGGAAKLLTDEKMFGRSSAYFDGNASYLSVPISTDFVFGTGNFTVECWVKFGTRPNSVSLIDYFKAGTSGWQLLVNADGYPQWYEANPGLYVLTSSIAVNNNSWHHILVSRYGSVVYMFIDGAFAGQTTNSKDYTAGADMLAIGAQMSTRNATYDYVGYIDEVRITKECRNRRAFEPSGLPMPNF